MHRLPFVTLSKLLILLGLSLTFRLIHTQIKHKKRTQQFLAEFISAESEGFEPPDQLPGHRISSAARSTTPATFQKERYCFSRSEEGRKGYLLRSIIKPGGDVMKLRVNKI